MMNVRGLALTILAAVGMGCSGNSNPLVGRWTTASSAFGETTQTTDELNSDGTVVVTSIGSGPCTGTETVTGLQWAATSSSVTFSGTGTCTGGITCGAITINCASQQSHSGSCTYALSNNDDTLTLSNCTGTSNNTFIRTP
jgi:hypothetical protein